MPPQAISREDVISPYSSEFYSIQQSGSVASADIVVPHVLSLFPVSSVVDVGCGVGGWLEIFDRHGIKDYLGVDGNYVPRNMLRIPKDRYLAADLRALPKLNRSFDLACSLEVAEHLPAECSQQFVAVLVSAAPVVLFSAAVPRQGGTSHLNEQWPSYWASLFARHGYVAVDCVRPAIYENERIEWWYRQNLLVFCRPDKCPENHKPVTTGYELNRVDPGMIENLYTPASGTEALKTIRRVLPILAKALVRKVNVGKSSAAS
jgi:SAM-dependent methyltransferase